MKIRQKTLHLMAYNFFIPIGSPRTVTDTVACKVGSVIKVKAAKTTVPYAEAHAMTHQNQWYSLDTQRISAL